MKLLALPKPLARSAKTGLAGSLAALAFWAGSTTLQGAELIASDGAVEDRFGVSAGVSGSIGIVGAQTDTVGANSNQGSAFVFRSLDTATGTITQNVKLTASDGAANDVFGRSVSLSGNIGLVGAYADAVGSNNFQGSAYVFRNLNTATGTVTQNVKLIASDGAASDFFGQSVSLSGGIGLVGAFQDTIGANSWQGSAYVFRNLDTATGTVTQNVMLTASDGAAADRFGQSVSLSGSIGLVGANRDDFGFILEQGSAYVFRGLDTATGSITENVKLTASDGANGDLFGTIVSLSGNIGLVGAFQDDLGFTDQGSAYVFRSLDTATGTITENVKLTASDGAAGDLFGSAVSLSGNIGLVGSYRDTIGSKTFQGSAYLFRGLDTATGTIIQNVKLTASDGIGGDSFGTAVGLDGDQLIISAIGRNLLTGKAYSGSVASMTTLDAGSTIKPISGISFISQDDWIIGQTTDANQVTLSANDAANVTSAGKAVFIGKNAGSDDNTLVVAGKVTATQITISAASGSAGNSVVVTATGSLVATDITVNSGGLLLLSGAGSTDRIGNATGITLAGGEIAFSGNVTEGNTPGTGALNLTASSIIDFGGGADVINFGASNLATWTSGAVLNIYNWGGSTAGGGADRLIFGDSSSGLTAGQLAQISFYDGDLGSNFLGIGTFVGSAGEVVPVPEPSSAALLYLSLTGLVGWRARRRQRPAHLARG